jgi:hypothetical protein
MIYEYKKCEHCGEEFHNIEGRSFSNHVRWCEKNPNSVRHRKKECPHCNKQIDPSGYKLHVASCLHAPENIRSCKQCGKQITSYEQKDFCSRSCSASYSNSRREFKNGYNSKGITLIDKVCPQCDNEFQAKRRKTIHCSKECYIKSKIKDDGSLKDYRRKCQFNFNLADYPNEYNFTLIEEYGWYKAKNHGDNLNGVSRDHIVSVRYGFDNNISPDIISHPANCQLMPHKENVRKNFRCEMTIEELQCKIKQWEEKYL